MSIYQIVDHADRAVANLISKFENATNFQELVRIFVDEIQQLDDLVFALISERYLSSAVGAQLDAYGVVLGFARQGFSDTEYRNLLEARALINQSEGQIGPILFILQKITRASLVLYIPTYPAAYIVQYTSSVYTSTSFREIIKEFILLITPCGVLNTIVEAPDSAFGFDDDPTALGFNEGPWAEIL
jgi:hypothetical protein